MKATSNAAHRGVPYSFCCTLTSPPLSWLSAKGCYDVCIFERKQSCLEATSGRSGKIARDLTRDGHDVTQEAARADISQRPRGEGSA